MAKAKPKAGKTKGTRFKVLMSFECPRKLLPKSKVGILVRGETFTNIEEAQFKAEHLDRLMGKGYIREMKPKKPKKGKKP